jgi:hypothetical protein
MTITHVDSGAIGVTILTNGTLNSIKMTQSPTSYHVRDTLCLVDDSEGWDKVLYNRPISTSYISVDSFLASNANISYANLTVRDVPPGAIFELDVSP